MNSKNGGSRSTLVLVTFRIAPCGACRGEAPVSDLIASTLGDEGDFAMSAAGAAPFAL